LGLPLFIPPKNFRKPFVLNPLQLNSSIITYPLEFSFSLINEWSLVVFVSPMSAAVEKMNALPFVTCGSESAKESRDYEIFLHISLNQTRQVRIRIILPDLSHEVFLFVHQGFLLRPVRFFQYYDDGMNIRSKEIS